MYIYIRVCTLLSWHMCDATLLTHICVTRLSFWHMCDTTFFDIWVTLLSWHMSHTCDQETSVTHVSKSSVMTYPHRSREYYSIFDICVTLLFWHMSHTCDRETSVTHTSKEYCHDLSTHVKRVVSHTHICVTQLAFGHMCDTTFLTHVTHMWPRDKCYAYVKRVVSHV